MEPLAPVAADGRPVAARRLAGGRPLAVVGHSMGAQLVALLPSAADVDALVAVAGGSGHWRGFDPLLRPLMLAMLHGVAPLLSSSFTDDRMMPQRNVDALLDHLRAVRRESRRLSPADAGGPIGHMGFFRRRYRDTLWPVAFDWLDALPRAGAR